MLTDVDAAASAVLVLGAKAPNTMKLAAMIATSAIAVVERMMVCFLAFALVMALALSVLLRMFLPLLLNLLLLVILFSSCVSRYFVFGFVFCFPLTVAIL